MPSPLRAVSPSSPPSASSSSLESQPKQYRSPTADPEDDQTSLDRAAPLAYALGLSAVQSKSQYDSCLQLLRSKLRQGGAGRIHRQEFADAVQAVWIQMQQELQAAAEDRIATEAGPPLLSPRALSCAEQRTLPRTARGVHAVALEAFDMIDCKRFGSISLADLTTFLVDSSALCVTQRSVLSALPQWTAGDVSVDTASRRPRRIRSVPGKPQIVIIDSSGSVYVYDEDKQSTRKLQLHFQCAAALDAVYMDPEYGFVISTVAGDLLFYDAHFNGYDPNKSRESIQHLFYNHVHNMVVGADRSGILSLWRVRKISQNHRFKTPILEQEIVVHRGVAACALACHSRLGTVVVGFDDGTVAVIHPLTGRVERRFIAASTIINELAVSEHANAILIGTNDFRPEVWSLTDSEHTKPFFLETREAPHDTPIVSVYCSPASSQAFTLDFSGTLKSWDLDKLSSQQTFYLAKDDVKVCWNSLAACGAAGETLYVTDRKSIRQFRMLRISKTNKLLSDDDAVSGGLLEPSLFLTHLPGTPSMILSVGGRKASFWRTGPGELAAEVNITISLSTQVGSNAQEEVTTVCLSNSRSLVIYGTSRGSVWIVNSATFGIVAEFRHLHRGRVDALTFVDHANFGVSIGEDGNVFILSPPRAVVLANLHDPNGGSLLMTAKGQQILRGMHGRVCQYFSCLSKGEFLLVADAELCLHIFDCGDIEATSRVLHRSSLEFPPAPMLIQHVPQPGSSSLLFRASGRSIIAMKQVQSNTQLIIVVDNSSFALVDAFAAEPRILARHNVEGMHDGTLSCAELLQNLPTQMTLLLGFETGLLVTIDVSEMLETSGQGLPVNLRSVKFRAPILSMTLLEDFESAMTSASSNPVSPRSASTHVHTSKNTLHCLQTERLAVGLADGFVDLVDVTSLDLIWSSSPKTSFIPKTVQFATPKLAKLAKYSFLERLVLPPGNSPEPRTTAGGRRSSSATATPVIARSPMGVGGRVAHPIALLKGSFSSGSEELMLAGSFATAAASGTSSYPIGSPLSASTPWEGEASQTRSTVLISRDGRRSPPSASFRCSLRTRNIRSVSSSSVDQGRGSAATETIQMSQEAPSEAHRHWVETQLRSLVDGYAADEKRQAEMLLNRNKEAVLFRTKNLDIPVYSGSDPFCEWEPAVFQKKGSRRQDSTSSCIAPASRPLYTPPPPPKILSQREKDPKEVFLEKKFGVASLEHFRQDVVTPPTPVRLHSAPIPNLRSNRDVRDEAEARLRGGASRTICLLRPMSGAMRGLVYREEGGNERSSSLVGMSTGLTAMNSETAGDCRPSTALKGPSRSPSACSTPAERLETVLLSRPLSSAAARVPSVGMHGAATPLPDASAERYVVGSPSAVAATPGQPVGLHLRRWMQSEGSPVHVVLPPWML
jgi:WD40 repeat protein